MTLPKTVRIEVINGEKHFVDRRIVELQPDGETILRDPETNDAWTPDGKQLPHNWKYGQEME